MSSDSTRRHLLEDEDKSYIRYVSYIILDYTIKSSVDKTQKIQGYEISRNEGRWSFKEVKRLNTSYSELYNDDVSQVNFNFLKVV